MKYLIPFLVALLPFPGMSENETPPASDLQPGDIQFTTEFFSGTWKIAFLYGPATADGVWELNPDGTGTLKETIARRQLTSGNPRDHPLRNGVGRSREVTTDCQWGISGTYLVIKRFRSDTPGIDKIHHALIPLELTPDQCTFKDKGNPKSRLVMTRVEAAQPDS